ncbi:adenylyl-sulfate kinase [Candidatus Laterigemmans baculatus]|uniref:adenylyl-sulfate kinase n=1 Tax=Candidatus Laterigemmans baculatus TaxID=2770505 RepID=UPI0013DD4312|nr:adenylyl-sulfate kinase [Candidatus Laterigemmans baculatus]
MSEPPRKPSPTNPEVVWHAHAVSRQQREQRLGQRGCVVWFTGLSGCGKSTVANAVDALLADAGAVTFLLDGDNIRHGLCAGPDRLTEEHGAAFAQRFGLGFAAEDREENIRRIGAVGELFASAGLITLTAFVSPYRRDRDRVRQRVEAAGRAGDFVEVFVDTPLEECERRDPKGLYKKARAGEIPHFTGISDPYEPPENPELRLDGSRGHTPQQMAAQVVRYLHDHQLIFSRA